MPPAPLAYDAWFATAFVAAGKPSPPFVPGSIVAGSGGLIPAHFISDALTRNAQPAPNTISALRVTGLTIQGDLHLENFTLPYSVFFEGCHFLGDLHVWRMKGRTLSFEGSVVDGGMELRGTSLDGHLLMRNGFTINGPLVARDVKIADTADVSGATFAYDGVAASAFKTMAAGEAFGFSRATAKALYWRRVSVRAGGTVTLRDAEVTSLVHDMDTGPLASWPLAGKLTLDGFRYKRIDQCETKNAIAWVNLQTQFAASSYAVLANAFATIGLPQKSEDVLAALKQAEIRQIASPWKRNIVTAIYWLIDYGQRPSRALIFLALLFAVHLGIVTWAGDNHAMRPEVTGMLTQACFYGPEADCKKTTFMKWSKAVPVGGNAVRYLPPDYPDLEPWEYSLESFIPIFDLGQRAYWGPSSDLLRIFLSLIAYLGIFLGGLFTGAIAGLMTPKSRSAG